MAVRVELGLLSTGTGSGAAAAEIIAGSSVPFSVTEISIFLNAATSSTFGIGVPAAIGVTPSNTLFLKSNPTITYTVVTNMALSWGTGPTVPANFQKRIVMPATIGSGIIWTWPYGDFVIPVSKSIVVWNLAANAAAMINVSGYEG